MPKRKITIDDKLAKADSFLDTSKFNEDDYVELYHRYIPQNKSTSWLLDTLKDSSTSLETHEQIEKLFYQQEHARQTILAIALSQLDKQRLKETEQRLKETTNKNKRYITAIHHLQEDILDAEMPLEIVLIRR